MAWAPDYCNGLDLDHYVSDGQDSVGDNVSAMDFAITAASRAVDRTCNRQFGKDDGPTARYYTAQHDTVNRRWVVPIDDLMTTTGLAVAFDSAGDFTFTDVLSDPLPMPLNAAQNGRPWTTLAIRPGSGVRWSGAPGAIRVTGIFGWSDIPLAVTQATLLQASRFLARRQSPYGVTGSPEAGGELRLLAKVDPDVEVALAPYRRWWAAA